LFAIELVAGAALGARAQAAALPAIDTPPSQTPRISVKQTDPVEVAYLENVGQYWRIGPIHEKLSVSNQ